MGNYNIPKMLKQLRKQSGLSVKEISRQLKEMGHDKVSYRTLYGYENGVAMPNSDVFLSICKICGCENPLQFEPTESREIRAVVSAYKKLHPTQREMVLNMLQIDPSQFREDAIVVTTVDTTNSNLNPEDVITRKDICLKNIDTEKLLHSMEKDMMSEGTH